MDVLILDTAARGHVEADMVAQSALFNPEKDNIYLYPERGLTSDLTDVTGVTSFEELDKDWETAIPELVQFAKRHENMVVIASADLPIAANSYGAFTEEGIRIASPTVEAAEIETSKKYMKDLATELSIPTARYEIFSERVDIMGYVREINEFPIVIKADGPSAGKGVEICHDIEELEAKLQEFEHLGWLGNGNEVVVEEYLEGPEISLHAWCDGDTYVMFPFAMQDHKTIYEDDSGPMTGGMGVVWPVPGLTKADIKQLGKEFIGPFVAALKNKGRPFKGVMYPSIKLTPSGPKLLEINARHGDPEALVSLPMLQSDFLEITLACAEGRLNELPKPKWRKGAAVCITMAAKGYPNNPESGALIKGIGKARKKKGVQVFDYGTKRDEEGLKVNSGRVLGVMARGKNLEQALKRAYRGADKIRFGGERPQMRKDIGRVACSQLLKDRVKIMRELRTT
jgi:phosphoribosylamine--glycine ligase